MHSRGGDGGNGSELPGLDTSVANPARVWNYWVGGKDNFAADREAAEKVVAVMPSMPLLAKAGRRFLVDASTSSPTGIRSGSSWTSGPGFRRLGTRMRSRSKSSRSPGSFMWTMTRW
jgi:hypothetical protein